MKTRMRNILSAVLALTLVGLSIAGSVIGHLRESRAKISRIDFQIDTPAAPYARIGDICSPDSPYFKDVIGSLGRSLKLDSLERALRLEPRIDDCEIYILHDTIMVVNAKASDVALIFKGPYPYKGAKEKAVEQCLCASSQGKTFAWSDGVDSSLGEPFTIYGEAPTGDEQWLGQMISLSNAIKADKQLRNIVSSIEVTRSGTDLFLHLDSRAEIIHFGGFTSRRKKFDRVCEYLLQIAPENDLKPQKKRFTSVDVRFDGQIVCK